MCDLLVDEKNYQIEGEVSERAVHELIVTGKLDELKELLDKHTHAYSSNT